MSKCVRRLKRFLHTSHSYFRSCSHWWFILSMLLCSSTPQTTQSQGYRIGSTVSTGASLLAEKTADSFRGPTFRFESLAPFSMRVELCVDSVICSVLLYEERMCVLELAPLLLLLENRGRFDEDS